MTTQSIHSRAFWRSYLVTARPYLAFVSSSAGLVGLVIAPNIGWEASVAAFAVCFVAYGLGQALTDTTQMDTDALSAPYRPLVQGVVSARQVTAVSLIGFGICGVVLSCLNPWALALAAIGVAGLGSYTWFKRRWWAGPLYNAWIVALLPAIGFLCGGAGPSEALASSRLSCAMVSIFFSYAVFVVLGYLKDIAADRATGYLTLPVRFGWRTTVLVSAALTALAFVASMLLVARLARGLPMPSGILLLGLWLGGATALVISHGLLLGSAHEAEAHRGIAWSVRGFVLLRLGEAAMLMPALALPALGFYTLFEIALALRPERSQV